jgi:hypothetical protein
MMGKDHWRGVLAVSACALVAGCGWFGGDSAAPQVKARPGADRLVAPTATLPPAPPGRGTEQGIAPVDETRTSSPQIGSVVATKGGQRAQKEAADKETADRDAKERDARDAAEREAKTNQQSIPVRTTPSEPPPVEAPAAPEPAPVTPKS